MKTFFLILSLLLVSCSANHKNDSSSPQVRTFLFGMRNDTAGELDFTASTSDPEVISAVVADLAVPPDQRLHISGAIERGNNGNMNWNWHFRPDGWGLAQMSIELCDGTPSDPQNNLDYWVDTVGSFCPWNSYVKQEIQQ